jgi:HEAT repeat protein
MDVQPQEQGPVTSSTNTEGVGPPAEDRESAQRVKTAGGWIHQFARTLKTCRLYHGNNPTVVKFRAELAVALTRILDELGPVTYKFSAEDIFFEDASLYPAKSRDDNLALPFHRDGVRSITFAPGMTTDELDGVINAVLAVTGQAQVDDDLVTLLWQANLKHVDVDCVPPEDAAGGSGEEGGVLVPWPTASVAEGQTGSDEATDKEDTSKPGTGSRSDDWATGESTVEVEAGFEELHSLGPSEAERFRAEFDAEHQVSLMTTALAITRAYLDADATQEDRSELARFLPRMLRLSISEGLWLEAREALELLRECNDPSWSIATFTQELLQPISVSAVVERLDRGEPAQVSEFVALAQELGDSAVEWISLALAESQHRRTRRLLAEAITALCRNNPERLAPWLADSRWYVVRNSVQVLGWIGGDAVVGMLRGAMKHRDPRVRREVVAAFGQVPSATARPLLIELIPGADSRTFCSILHQLSSERDIATGQMLMRFVLEPYFTRRTEEERRAIYAALGAVGTDEVLPDLEAELTKGNWLTPGIEAHRQAIASCIARIGTAQAITLLERGVASRRAVVREACIEALRSIHGKH